MIDTRLKNHVGILKFDEGVFSINTSDDLKPFSYTKTKY